MFKYDLLIEIMKLLSDYDIENIDSNALDEYYPQAVEITDYIIKNNRDVPTYKLGLYIKKIFDDYYKKDYEIDSCIDIADLIQLKLSYM